jgi:hypothetical protein
VVHEVFVEVLLELLDRHLSVARRVVHCIDVDLLRHVLAHLNEVREAVIDRTQLLEHHEHVGKENYHFVGGCVQDLHDEVDVILQLLDETVNDGVAHLVNRIEEVGNKVAIDLELLEMRVLAAHEERGDLVVQVTDDRFGRLRIGLLIELVC